MTVRAEGGGDIWWSLSGTAHFDEYGRFLGFSGIGTDLTEQAHGRGGDQQACARYDALTGLPNRTLDARRRWRTPSNGIEKQKKGCALFLIDLDRFKNVNDTMGHPVGDALLKQVAERLTAVIGKDGQVGRIGGDEFQAVFPAIDSENWLGTMAKPPDRPGLAALSDRRPQHHDRRLGRHRDRAQPVSVRRRADPRRRPRALCRQGRRARHLQDVSARHAQRRAGTARDGARPCVAPIQRGEIRLVYQPVVNAKPKSSSRFEALVRWVHPQARTMPTEQFIAIGRGMRPDHRYRRVGAAHRVPGSRAMADQLRIAVNISPIALREPHIGGTVINAIGSDGLDPDRLELEITEGVFLSDDAEIDDTFRRLKAAGVRTGARRFRDRLFSAWLSEARAAQQDQDRPVVRARRRRDGAPVRRSCGRSSRSRRA